MKHGAKHQRTVRVHGQSMYGRGDEPFLNLVRKVRGRWSGEQIAERQAIPSPLPAHWYVIPVQSLISKHAQ